MVLLAYLVSRRSHTRIDRTSMAFKYPSPSRQSELNQTFPRFSRGLIISTDLVLFSRVDGSVSKPDGYIKISGKDAAFIVPRGGTLNH